MNQKTVRLIRRASRSTEAIAYLPKVIIHGEHGRSRGVPPQKTIERWVRRAYNCGDVTIEQLKAMAR